MAVRSPSWLSRPHSLVSSSRWPFDAHSDERERREAPGEAACAAETGRPLLLFSRPLKQTHGVWPKGQHAALHDAERDTRCARSLTAREVAPAERRWRMHGGSKTPPQRQRRRSRGEGTFLAAGPREARSYLKQGQQHSNVPVVQSTTQGGCSQQSHVEPPHLHSQKQTLSAAYRVEQGGAGGGRSAVGDHEGRAGRGPSRAVRKAGVRIPRGV